MAFINPAHDQARAVRVHLAERGELWHAQHDAVGILEITSSGTEPVYDTVLTELGVVREYSFRTVDFANP